MNDQNKSNFEDFYLRLQNLIGKPDQTRSNETSDKECQYEELVQEKEKMAEKGKENKNGSDNGNGKEIEIEKGKANGNGKAEENINGEEKEYEKDVESDKKELVEEGEEEVDEDEEELVPNTPEQLFNKAADTDNDESSLVKCTLCNCCFREGHECRPCSPDETDTETPTNEKYQARETGGYSGCIEIQNFNTKEEVKLLNSCSESFPNAEKETFQGFCQPQSSATSGKMNCFCNAYSHAHDWIGNKMKTRDEKIVNGICNNKIHLQLISPRAYENYDTSGYATEPEDNSEATIVSSGRKKLQKKSAKPHKKPRQPSAVISLQAQDAVPGMLDDGAKRSSSQARRKLSRSSLRSRTSSPTRLSRL